MFTGIIEEVGKVKAIRRSSSDSKIIIACSKVLGKTSSLKGQIKPFTQPTAIGDSIAVNGVCLTVTAMDNSTFTADVMPETFERSSLGKLRPGDPIDLERAMAADGRFGGHIVSGHIDGVGTIESLRRDGNAVWFEIAAAPEILRYIVTKGSITIDGISLTVASVSDRAFKVSIIPHTLEATALSAKKAGSIVNLENDIIGKYVEKLIGGTK
ncbi:riboflavin synthase [Aminicella lysinilytica]|uniref:Riboflavin synthase n=2 Tax=Aminicella lysinilytica TaxID=433323 RepID=A0A4R6Q5E4_9FIRM|nr:riboflavin synthase [Aminicella lysinilytica]NLD11106.1 riboflavin synthase [Clostridiales bacterium]TDP57461.1 riboflavin synthase alpha chain [Aminicella lysinilytica]